MGELVILRIAQSARAAAFTGDGIDFGTLDLGAIDAKTYAMVMLTGAAVDADGWSKIHIVGPAAHAKMQNAVPDAPRRPNLSP